MTGVASFCFLSNSNKRREECKCDTVESGWRMINNGFNVDVIAAISSSDSVPLTVIANRIAPSGN